MKLESEHWLDEAGRMERSLRQLDNAALDTMHGLVGANPTLISPTAFMAVAELKAVFQRYGAAGDELRSKLGTTKRTGGGKVERKEEIAKQAAIGLFANAMFRLSGAHRDLLVSRLARAAFKDYTISDRDVYRLRSRR